MSGDPVDDSRSPKRDGSGPMIFMVVGCILLCAGSFAGIGFFAFRTIHRAAEQEEEAVAERAAILRAKNKDDVNQERFDRVAKAVAEGLKAQDRLADSYSRDGQPLLSWRVHLLPRIGEIELYRKFKLDEPWDSPSNRGLIDQTPVAYLPTTHVEIGLWTPGWTHIRGFCHSGAIFEPNTRYTLKDLSNGPENTIALVDAGEPDLWTKPDTLKWTAGGPRPKLGWIDPERDWFLAGSADGQVWKITRKTPDQILRRFFVRQRENGDSDLLSLHGTRVVPLQR